MRFQQLQYSTALPDSATGSPGSEAHLRSAAMAPRSCARAAQHAATAVPVLKITQLPEAVLAKCLGFLDLKERCAPEPARLYEQERTCAMPWPVGRLLDATRGHTAAAAGSLQTAGCSVILLQAGSCVAGLQALCSRSPQP